MTESNFNYLFYFLEKEEITVDKDEFLFQMKSHPNYPSLLAIADTLSFFNIENGALHVDASDIPLLPDRFLTLLQEISDKSELSKQLYFVEKKNDVFFSTKTKKMVETPYSLLESRWQNVVLLVEKTNTEVKLNKTKFYWILPLICIIGISGLFYVVESSFQEKLFFIFPLIGFFCSIAALKDLFGVNSKLINQFCNISISTNCNTVIGSEKWAIFKIVNFSDLSIIFFTAQFLGLLFFMLAGNSALFFSIQQVLLFSAIPVILLSLYFQKFVEKKWCPICLAIIAVIISELLYLTLISGNRFVISFQSIILFSSIFLLTIVFWFLLKKILTAQKELKEFQLKANRFLRNYEVFKNTLIAKDKIEMPFDPIIMGNKDSKTQITMITNPFCGYCREAHEIIENILEKHTQDLQVRVVINIDLTLEDDLKKDFYRCLMNIYFEEGQVSFRKALNFWFENKDLENWMKIFKTKEPDINKIDHAYALQNSWCKNNKLNYTPIILINGYKYPHVYERESLYYFINDLIEDHF